MDQVRLLDVGQRPAGLLGPRGPAAGRPATACRGCRRTSAPAAARPGRRAPGETSGRPRSSGEPAHHSAYACILPMNSHGSVSVTSTVSGVLVVRSTHGESSSRWLGCGPPRSRSVSATARASPPPAESPASTTPSEDSQQPLHQLDDRLVRVAPGVLGRERVVGQHHPGAERRGQPGGVPHLEGVDRRRRTRRRAGRRRSGSGAARAGSACTTGSRPEVAAPRGPRRSAGRTRHRSGREAAVQGGVPPLEPGPLGLGASSSRDLRTRGTTPGEQLVAAARHGRNLPQAACHSAGGGRCLVGRRNPSEHEREAGDDAQHQHVPDPQGRDHRPLRRGDEAVRQAKLGGEFPDNGYVYFHHKQVLKAVMSFEGKVEKWDAPRPEPQVLRPARQRRRDRLLLVPRLRLLHGPQRRARPGQGARGAALARVRRLHAARARRPGVRRGDDRHAADRHRRDGGAADRRSSARRPSSS